MDLLKLCVTGADSTSEQHVYLPVSNGLVALSTLRAVDPKAASLYMKSANGQRILLDTTDSHIALPDCHQSESVYYILRSQDPGSLGKLSIHLIHQICEKSSLSFKKMQPIAGMRVFLFSAELLLFSFFNEKRSP